MGKILVIAEKPKTAKLLREGLSPSQPNISFVRCGTSAIGAAQVGYYENDNVIIAYTRGHLMSLYDVEDYVYGENAKLSKEQKSWSNTSLPFVPDKFKRKLTSKNDKSGFCEKQFKVIKKLVNRDDVDFIVHYGDPDNEGELLVREVLEEANCTKPVKRLFTNSLVPSVIASAFYTNLKDDRDYFYMYQEALARQQTDWLLGINLTRYITMKADTGTLWRVGRVIVPIVKYVYDRNEAIENFSSTKTIGINAIVSDGDFSRTISSSIPKISFPETEKEECEKLKSKLEKQPMTIENIEKAKFKIKPKKFMSQTDFRCEMNKIYGYSIDESTVVAQTLYEAGFITYPRTDTQYLSTKEKDNVKDIINLVSATYNINLNFKDTKTIFDDDKVSKEGHTALTLTIKLPTKDDLDDLGQACKDGYKLILSRFISNFYTQPVVEETTVTLKCGEYMFKLTGNEVVDYGFLPYEKRNILEKLPDFVIGQVLDTEFEVVERETKPPKPVSLTELLHYLSNPYEKELKKANPNDDAVYYKLLKEGVSIGTQATINTILNNAIQDKYIIASKKSFMIGERGKTLIKLLDSLQINLYKERNIQMNKDIIAVGNKSLTLEQNVENVKNELENIIANNAHVTLYVDDSNQIAICPLCGGKVKYNPKSKIYYCENRKPNGQGDWGCKFRFGEDDKFLSKWGVKVTKSVVSAFARNGFITFASKKKDKNGKWRPCRIKISVTYPEDSQFPKYTVEKISEVQSRTQKSEETK